MRDIRLAISVIIDVFTLRNEILMARNIKSRPLKNREGKKRRSFLEKSAKKERLIFSLPIFQRSQSGVNGNLYPVFNPVLPFSPKSEPSTRHRQPAYTAVTEYKRVIRAEREGFEPPEARTSTVFKTAAIDHSATSPVCLPRPLKRGAKVRNIIYPARRFAGCQPK